MDLIIVESPTKAKTLTKFLKGKYAVTATMGHIRDLPKGDFGVDLGNGFIPSYVTPRDKMKRVKELVEEAKKADHVILATDRDREGEAIAWHVATVINHKTKSKASISSFDRIVFH
jgi:DNA topoisomerase I